jgi:hypothetical protein
VLHRTAAEAPGAIRRALSTRTSPNIEGGVLRISWDNPG